jgi:hypothetical protein
MLHYTGGFAPRRRRRRLKQSSSLLPWVWGLLFLDGFGPLGFTGAEDPCGRATSEPLEPAFAKKKLSGENNYTTSHYPIQKIQSESISTWEHFQHIIYSRGPKRGHTRGSKKLPPSSWS